MGDNNAGSVNSTQFPDNVRTGMIKGAGRGTRGRGLRYLSAARGQHAPPLHLSNFSGAAIQQLNAANAARPKTQRLAKMNRKARLQAAKNKGRDPLVLSSLATIPEGQLNNNAEQTPGPNETPLPKTKPAENLGNKQNGMSNTNLNALLNGLPRAGAGGPAVGAAGPAGPAVVPAASPATPTGLPPGTTVQTSGFGPKYSMNFEPSSNATLSAFGTGGKASNINTGGINKNTNLLGPSAFAPANSNFSNAGGNTQAAAAARLANMKTKNPNYARTNAQLNAARVSATMAEGVNANYSGGFKKGNAAKVNNFEPSSNALLPGYGTGGKASNINKGGIALNTNLQGPLALAPSEANFANAGGNTKEAAAARVQAMKNASAGTNTPYAPSGPSLGDLNNADLIVDVVFSDVNAIPRGGKIGVNLTKKDGSKFLGLPSMGLGMPSMPSMPRMPSFAGPKMDLSFLKLPKFPKIVIPETHVLETLAGLLAYLPSGATIIAALKKGGKFLGTVFMAPLVFAAWLYEHGFAFPKLDSMTGGLIDLSDWFSAGKTPAVKAIGVKLKLATEIAKRVITNTIAEQELLQRQVNQRTRTQDSVKAQILHSLDGQIENIKTTFKDLTEETLDIFNDPDYLDILADMNLEDTSSLNVNMPALKNLNTMLNGIQKFYEKVAEADDAKASDKANVEKFKKIRENFKEIVELPQKIRAAVADAAPPLVGKVLKDQGIKARSRLAQMGQKVGQFLTNTRSALGSLFTRKATNANKAVPVNRNAVAYNNPIGAGNAPPKKKTFRNRLGNVFSYFSRKKQNTPSPSAANTRLLNQYKAPKVKTARNRKNRRHH